MNQRTSSMPRPATCKSWCTDHYLGAHPDDSECRRIVASDYDGQPIIVTYNLDQAEAARIGVAA